MSPDEGGVIHREDRGGGVISLSSSSSLEDLDLVGISTPRSFAAQRAALRARSLSPHAHIFTLEARLAPASLCPWVDWHSVVCYECLQDPTQGCERVEKIEQHKTLK
jgi:hypothetical protein